MAENHWRKMHNLNFIMLELEQKLRNHRVTDHVEKGTTQKTLAQSSPALSTVWGMTAWKVKTCCKFTIFSIT
jgi:hypothetical protein